MAKPSQQFVKVARLFLGGQVETYATVLLAIVLKTYGPEALTWDPATIEAQLTEDFGVEMPDVVYDQLMALVNVLATDSVYYSVDVFDRTVSALTRCGVDADHDMPTAEELAWTVFEIMANDPDPYGFGKDAPYPFSHDISLYCGVVLADAGLKRPPKSLEFAVMPHWVPKDLKDSPGDFRDAYQSEEELASYIDQFVEHHFMQLVEHLRELGVEPAQALLEESKDLPEEDPLEKLLPRGI